MQTPPDSTDKDSSAAWAQPVKRLEAHGAPAGAFEANLAGRQMTNPQHGFGQLWRRTYRVRLSGVQATPEQVVRDWKANFANFQPPENRFYPSLAGVKPGEMVYIDTNLLAVPGLKPLTEMSSGVMVLYADDTTFSVMTPEGFPVSGWNTFSAYEEDGVTVAQVQGMERAADPIYEFGYRVLGGEGRQDRVWLSVLANLAKRWGVQGQVMQDKICLDSGLQWRNFGNLWKNAMLRTLIYKLLTPFRWLAGLFKSKRAA